MCRVYVENLRCLDLCSGYGWGGRFLSKATSSLVSVDFELEKVEHAKRLSLEGEVSNCVADAGHLPFDKAFDVVTFINGYQWVEDRFLVLKSIENALVESGILLLATKASGRLLGLRLDQITQLVKQDLQKHSFFVVRSEVILSEVTFFESIKSMLSHVFFVIRKN